MVRKKWQMIWNLPRLLKQSWALYRNPNVPSQSKFLILIISLGYLFWPLDLIPDFPIIGQIDDIGVIFLLLNWFVNRFQENKDYIEPEYYYSEEEEKRNK